MINNHLKSSIRDVGSLLLKMNNFHKHDYNEMKLLGHKYGGCMIMMNGFALENKIVKFLYLINNVRLRYCQG